eukprot:385514-Prymnesium_polylepis.1
MAARRVNQHIPSFIESEFSSKAEYEAWAAAQGMPTTTAPEHDFARLPEDLLSSIYTLLPARSLRAAAASNTAWCRALRLAPVSVRRRADWLHEWTSAGAGAFIELADAAVCAGD